MSLEDATFGTGAGQEEGIFAEGDGGQAQAQPVPAAVTFTAEQFQQFLAAMQNNAVPQGRPQPPPVADDDPSHWKNIKPNDIPLHEGKKDKTRSASWLRSLKDYAQVRGLPQSQWTRLAAMRLTGDAAIWFEGYVNPTTGEAGDRTMDWDLFARAYLKATIDVMNAEQIKDAWESDKLKQHSSVERCVDNWNLWLNNYRSCEELRNFYSEAQIVDKFIRGLKGPVAALVKTNKDVKTFDEAVEAAKKIDPVIFNANKNQNGGRGGSGAAGGAGGSNTGGGRLPSFTFHNRDSRSREGTPGPPGTPASVHALSERDKAIINALNALGAQFQGRGFQPRSGSSTPGSSSSSQYNSRNPPPKMTPGIREWCDKNRACYRCRTPNADHMSRQCPHFQERTVNSIDQERDPVTDALADLIDFSEPAQGNGQ
mmetsp:Transcript_5272/g.10594  ORF Transcript_5272/g.10594 Transcript_5272/m.10594 type:complete len:426 (+) Transcript_5272:388-1665(+)|eukprot:CAMPEP_0181298708 /NCGR_PEP_ID=MMETSP1101-20121128/5930_1 /TAXON_ID=46948 /ORGANISM="Rhodomonas abbreviata, Strain Caron Lab Isolate" /LENGTH=425 /DNA_ID=CAMNT_0023403755 /DNA_START=375 /DNA_END=1652 /DNA_ORIENTATION=-